MANRKREDENGTDESPQAKRRRREAFERERADNARAAEQARRNLFTLFKMWTICPDKRCIRAHACAGDVEVCLRVRWHAVITDETRARLQKTIALLNEGYTPQEAAAAVEQEMARHRAAAAAFAARKAEPPPAPPRIAPVVRTAPPSRSAGPRVRTL